MFTVTATIKQESDKERNYEQTQDRTDYSTSPPGESAAPAAFLRGCTGAATAAGAVAGAGAIVRPICLDSLAILLSKNPR